MTTRVLVEIISNPPARASAEAGAATGAGTRAGASSSSGTRAEQEAKEARADAPIALFTLSYPAKRNVLSAETCQELLAAITQAAEAGARAAVLTGAGDAFCAGYDLHEIPEAPDAQWLLDHGPLATMMRLVSQGPLPVVAALNGATVGGGCELALSCDLRVAHPATRLQMPPVNLGLIYTPEGVARLVAMCGLGRARQMLLTGEPVLAPEAQSWGLVHHVVPADQVLPTALQLARTLAQKPQKALLGTRILIERLLREGPLLSAQSAQEIFALREQAFHSSDSRAARAGFRARMRPPSR